jgi:dTDP-glucose 4,6-dehydratase
LEKTVDWYIANQEWVKEVTTGDYQKYYTEQYSKR